MCLTNSRSIAVTGVSGAGKTRSVEAILRMYPKVITHDVRRFPHLPLKQVVWIKIDFPSNRSPKALCRKFFYEMGQAVGEPYDTLHRRENTDELLADMARIARDHFLGLLVIDEVQHACGKNGTASPLLMRFIITLSNELKMPILFVGTSKATNELRKRMATCRRLIGQNYDYFEEKDEQWLHFLAVLWDYQYTRAYSPIDATLLHEMHVLTQGIPAFAVALFVLAQRREITRSFADPNNTERLDVDTLRSVYRDYFRAIDPIITAIREGDLAKIDEFEDLHSTFQLSDLLKGQMDVLLSQETKRIELAVRKCGREFRKRLPKQFEEAAQRLGLTSNLAIRQAHEGE